ncbi:MAG: DUF4097 family beta strand repeat protein [Clostridia bacterium]|nr:DUF4097 family beta strand repeat protein [Clostridia bacterium]
MKRKKILCLAAVLLGLSLVGCKPSAERGFRFYDDAAAYEVGEFTCDNAAVKRIEIDWLGGNVEVEQSASDKTTVFEEENDLSEEKRLHTYLNDGVLHVKYCRSGCHGKIDEMQKNLQVDVPKGVDVEINGVSANVYLGILEAGELSVETDTGCVEAERILCKSADIETHSGYIGIGALTADRAKLDSVSGEIHLGIPTCQNTEIETKNGNVTLYLQGDVCALIGFETQKGVLQTQRKYERKGQDYFFAFDGQNTVQGSPAKISVETESGNLRIQ